MIRIGPNPGMIVSQAHSNLSKRENVHVIVTLRSYNRNTGTLASAPNSTESIMIHKTLRHTTLAATMAASALCGASSQAQSVDALLDKLVDKGVLTTKEANDLKEETDAGFNKAYQVKSGMPDWVTSFKINGDFRGRAEGFLFDTKSFPDRVRYRYRLRVGGVAVIRDNFEVGFRLTSSEFQNGFNGGDPISGNTTLQDNGQKKPIFVDLAYGKWTPLKK